MSAAGDSREGAPSPARRFRAGIVGAGLISEHHLGALDGIDDVEVVGVYDADLARAEVRAREWHTQAYPSLDALFDAGADVIHVLTPPNAHAEVALAAIERGCDVLIEKPVAESAEDALLIADSARARGVTVTVNHSLLFDPQVMRALARVRAGAIGDVVGVDIFRCQRYPPYEGGTLPPYMRQPAYPWRDLGIHCLYLIEELLGEIDDVEASWRSLGGDRNLAFDEWRALVRCERGVGQLLLSWNAQPDENQIFIHGTHGTLRADLFAMFGTKRSATPLPKAGERVLNAYAEALRPLAEVPVSSWRFLRREIRPYQGVRNFVKDFYRRLAAGEPPRVAVEDAASLVRWVEDVAQAAEDEHTQALARFELSSSVRFVVTGASGTVGSAVLRRLSEEGHSVRAFVRQPPAEPLAGVEYAFGNLGDPEAVENAVRGAEIVIHAGAAMSGGWTEHRCATVIGTENVVEACRRCDVPQLVHISSLSVVDWTGLAALGRPVDEGAPLEPHAELRGNYTQAKLAAEEIVSAAAQAGLPAVILRPGVIFGGGIPLLGPAVARRAGGRWLVLGSGDLTVPLVYLDDVVDAILAAVEREVREGEVIQLVDDDAMTQAEILAAATGDPSRHVPRAVALALGKLSEYPLRPLGRRSPVNAYRLRSALAPVSFASARAAELLDWHPRVGVREGIRRVTAVDPPPRGGIQRAQNDLSRASSK